MNCAIPLTGLEPLSHTSVALTAQYLSVRQPKLGTSIVQQTVHILQHDNADTGSLPSAHEGFFQAQSKLHPNNPARQEYRYTSIPMEAEAYYYFIFLTL